MTDYTEQLFLFLKDFAQHNQDSFEPEQIEILLKAAEAIRDLDEGVESLIDERDDAYEQIDRFKNGFEGSCMACEPVALRNQELLKERDSARWEVCELSGNGSIDSAMRVAEERGWNLTNRAEEEKKRQEEWRARHDERMARIRANSTPNAEGKYNPPF
jgi:hypothetical protein